VGSFYGKDALINEHIKGALEEGKAMDIGKFEGDDIWSFVRRRLRADGANV
jgi:hypothetical protein